MKTLIIYYSSTGTTDLISKVLANSLNSDIVKINDLKSREGFKNKITASYDAFRENKTKIHPETVNLENYDTIYIGTPVWAGNPTPAIVTIIDACNLKGKDVVIFATMNSKGGLATVERLEQKVKARGGRVIETFTIRTKDRTQDQLINIAESLVDVLDLKIYK